MASQDSALGVDQGEDVETGHGRQRIALLSVWLLALAPFGPYLAAGARIDNVLVWVLLPVAVLGVIGQKVSARASTVLAAWVLLVVVALFAHLVPVLNTSGYARGNALAGLDALGLPVAALLLGLTLVHRVGQDKVFTVVSQGLVLGMMLNAGLAMAQSQSDAANQLIGRLWGLTLEDSTLARAESVGRFSGMMQQPALAGAMYGLALIVGCQVLAHRPVMRDVVWLVLASGAALSASKAFWLVGLPIALVFRYVQWRRQGVPFGLGRFVALVVAAIASASLLGVSMRPVVDMLTDPLARVSEAAGGGVGGITGNRFGDTGVVDGLVTHVLRDSPATGYGVAGLATSTDSGFLQILVFAGVLGLVLFTVVCASLVRYAWDEYHAGHALGGVYVAITVAVVVWSIGFPTLTGNRIATPLWVLVAVLVALPGHGVSRQRAHADPPSTTG